MESLRKLDITGIEQLLTLAHPQLIEVGRQLDLSNVGTVLFVESVINHAKYGKKHTINEQILSDDIKSAYQLVNLLKKLRSMGIRDNWDLVTEEVYTLIDETKNIQHLIALIDEAKQIDKNDYIAWDLSGLINARRGFLADAQVALKRALVKNPNYLHARFNHARLLHYELNELQRAKTEYECIIRMKANFSRAYNSYAKLLEKLGDSEAAEKNFRRAIQLRPKSISYRHCLANILSSQSRHLEVQQIYQESVSQHPKSATLRFHHALALVKCKYFRESELEFKNALKLNSKNAQIYHEYAKFCERHRQPPDYKKATDLYFKACSMDPIHYLVAVVDAANLMRRLDTSTSRQSARQLFEKLVLEAPHLNGAFLGYAKLLVREKQYKKAEEILVGGLQQHPKDDTLKQYYAEYRSISSSRPSIVYTPQPSSSAAKAIIPHVHRNGNGNNSGSGSGSGSGSRSSAARMERNQSVPSQSLSNDGMDKNLKFTTSQFVKGMHFDAELHEPLNSPSSNTTMWQQGKSRYSSTANLTHHTASNMSATSLSLTADMDTPPLPHKYHHAQNRSYTNNSSLSLNTIKRKDSEFRYRDVAEVALNETETERSVDEKEKEGDNKQQLQRRISESASSPRRYTTRNSESLQQAAAAHLASNPLDIHRQSIKKKVTINESDIFGSGAVIAVSSNSSSNHNHNHNGSGGAHNNGYAHVADLSNSTAQSSTYTHPHGGATHHKNPLQARSSNAAPRTSAQFNPQVIKKRQSQQFENNLPLIAATQDVHVHAHTHNKDATHTNNTSAKHIPGKKRERAGTDINSVKATHAPPHKAVVSETAKDEGACLVM
eukprot:CAMPEP_0202700882 /NCGR_PEP_ID=MMETSP1385-20130828/14023_1 /ASSEMBLY_ACC=CAM_ASM_000861 /TAXON_ID=933848 /ORGANISM="Elphidium margaritaceum" /LENGTH=833 /DNA_ID=CAMNT_0049358169 /DNA_START=86 /DNA_END=2587 /DNA_ORIENTATION=-